jgi:hypothetical protein
MAAPYLLSESAVLSTTPEGAFDAVLASPLEEILGVRAGLVPAITGCSGQDGPWGTVGQTRTIEMADGGRVLETLVTADRPTHYRYRISDVRGPMRPLVRAIDGGFAFEAADDGTKVTWSWDLHSTNALARLALPVLGRSWHRAARKMFDRLAERVSA